MAKSILLQRGAYLYEKTEGRVLDEGVPSFIKALRPSLISGHHNTKLIEARDQILKLNTYFFLSRGVSTKERECGAYPLPPPPLRSHKKQLHLLQDGIGKLQIPDAHCSLLGHNFLFVFHLCMKHPKGWCYQCQC